MWQMACRFGRIASTKSTDVFGVEDAISARVAHALGLHLSPKEERRVTRRYTDNLAAYQLYLTGRYHWSRITPPEIRKSIAFFQQAIALDPAYALAYAGLAEAYRSLPITSDVPPNEAIPQAKAARFADFHSLFVRLGLGRGGAGREAGDPAQPKFRLCSYLLCAFALRSRAARRGDRARRARV